MPRPLGHIRILLSSRVIFDLEEADKIFAEKGAAEYADYMRARGAYVKDYDPEVLGRRFKPGPMWNFVLAALELNNVAPGTVEIGMICKDTGETALPIFRNLDVSGVGIEYRLATAGKPIRSSDLNTFNADLFLSRNAADVQKAVDLGIAAAVINFPAGASYQRLKGRPLRFWVDGDAVTFDSDAELGYQTNGLEKYRKDEFNKVAKPLGPGPFTAFLAKLSQANARFPRGEQPFELSLLTARGGPAAARVIPTVEKLGIEFNGELYFLGGADKTDALKAHMPDIFFDDQMVHLDKAQFFCPTGHVPYKTGSAMFNFLKEKAAAEKKPDAPQP